MKMVFALLVLTLAVGCRRPVHTEDVSAHLKNAMREFLQKSLKQDSAFVKFDVQDLSYFEDKDFYECEFRVRMKGNGSDTTGIMQARITRDFSTVARKW